MMGEKKEGEKLYKKMLKGMIIQLEQKNIEVVEADIAGYKKPKIIENHKPDIVGINKDGKPVIIKVVTGNIKNSKKTKETFREFSEADGEFWVEVPESYSREIAEKIREWKTPIDKWFVGKDI